MKHKFICPKCKKECGKNHDGGVICIPCGKIYAKTASEVAELLSHHKDLR